MYQYAGSIGRGVQAESRQFSLDPLMREDEVRQAYQSPFPTSIPVIYRSETIASATLYGSNYIYTLPRGVEQKVVDGRIEINLGRDLLDFAEGLGLHIKFRIVAIDLRDKDS